MKPNSTANSNKDSCEKDGGAWDNGAGICKKPGMDKKQENPVNKVMPAFFVPPDESAQP